MPPSPPIKPALKYLDDLLSRTLRSREAPPAQLPATVTHTPPAAVSDASKPALESLLDRPVSRRKFMDYVRKGAVAASQTGKLGGILRNMPDGPPPIDPEMPHLNEMLGRLDDEERGVGLKIPNIALAMKKMFDQKNYPSWHDPMSSKDQMDNAERAIARMTEDEKEWFESPEGSLMDWMKGDVDDYDKDIYGGDDDELLNVAKKIKSRFASQEIKDVDDVLGDFFNIGSEHLMGAEPKPRPPSNLWFTRGLLNRLLETLDPGVNPRPKFDEMAPFNIDVMTKEKAVGPNPLTEDALDFIERDLSGLSSKEVDHLVNMDDDPALRASIKKKISTEGIENIEQLLDNFFEYGSHELE